MEVSPDDICYPYSEDTKKIIDCAFSVANYLGHGFLEAVYQKCLEIELTSAGIPFESQKDLRIYYKGEDIGLKYRADIVSVLDEMNYARAVPRGALVAEIIKAARGRINRHRL